MMMMMFMFRCIYLLKFCRFIYSMESSPNMDFHCTSWSWKQTNPIIYWINGNHSLHRRKQFYAYMSYVNFLHHRVKWKLKSLSLNRMFVGNETLTSFVDINTHLLSAFSSHLFALISASNHFQMYADFIYSM